MAQCYVRSKRHFKSDPYVDQFPPELLSELLGQLVHDGVAVVLNSLERGQVAVLLQHTAGVAVRSHCLSVGLHLQTLIQSSRQFKQKLQLP